MFNWKLPKIKQNIIDREHMLTSQNIMRIHDLLSDPSNNHFIVKIVHRVCIAFNKILDFRFFLIKEITQFITYTYERIGVEVRLCMHFLKQLRTVGDN